MAESTGFTRRHFLTVATAVTGGVGAIATAVPFVASFRPSARAQALGAPVEVDISKVELGALLKVEWRGHPIYIVHRTERMLESLKMDTSQLRDPDSKDSIQPQDAENEYRSVRPAFLVLEGVCTHLAVRRCRASRWLRPIWAHNGRAASTVRAMALGSTSRVACSRVCPHRPT